MPINTRYYGLTAFSLNDVYSASADLVRFNIIDSQLSSLSSFVGDGVIYGWDVRDVSPSGSLIIEVTAGIGISDRIVYRTFGDIRYTVADNTSVYVYMQKKFNYIGGFSPFSNIVTIQYEDNFPPPPPSSITVVGWDYNFVSISWDSIPSEEPDFSHYAVYRSTDNFATEAQIDTSTTNSYTDTTVVENTIYRYRVTSVDLTGNESNPSPSTGDITTLTNIIPPLDPYYILAFPGDEFLNIMWKASESVNTQRYELWIQELDDEYNPVGGVSVESLNPDVLSFKIENLVNGVFYRVTLYTVNSNNIYSSGINVMESPISNFGPEEVSSITLSDEQNVKNQYGIRLNIGFVPGVDPYNEFVTERYVITIIENGVITSEHIYVYNETSLFVDLFIVNGGYRPFLSSTDYIVKIEAEDEEGHLSNPVVNRIETSEYITPAAPTGLQSSQNSDGDLIFSWINSNSDFDYNEVSLIRTNLSNGQDVTIEDKTNYLKQSTYRIERADLALNSRYTITLRSISSTGIRSEPVRTGFDTLESITGTADIPTGLTALRGNGFVRLQWDKVTSTFPSQYKIWRAPYVTYGLSASDFSLVATISSDYTSYDDYTISTGGRYYYFVTTVDVYGRESLNPIDDNYFFYPLAFGYYRPDESQSQVSDLQAQADEHDVIVSWAETIDEFDGYEIWRSDGDDASWEKVGDVSKEFTVFIDENALLVGGQYYYMVRRFRNEGHLFVTNSFAEPVNSVLLAIVTARNGSISINTSVKENVDVFSTMLENFIENEVTNHSHDLASDRDLRIDLDKNVTVTDSDWETTDNIVFTTTKDIVGASDYVVWQAGEILSVPFEVDANAGTITFSEVLGSSAITLECVGLDETNNTLPGTKVGYPSATKAYSGRFPKEQLPAIDHDGRKEQELLPLQLPMVTSDGYGFGIEENQIYATRTANLIAADIGEEQEISGESIGSSITFYDIVDLSENISSGLKNWFPVFWVPKKWVPQRWFPGSEEEIVFRLNDTSSVAAATSRGLLRWGGSDWEVAMETDSAPHRIYYASSIEKYFALTGTSVYVSNDGLTWVQCLGFDGISVVRDITEDSNNNVFVTTDRGVYKTNETDPFAEYLFWEQTSQVDSLTSNTYAIWNDITNSRIVVSAENGLFSTVDDGSTWNAIVEIDSDEMVQSFLREGDLVYALTNSSVWRKRVTDGEFEAIASLNSVAARKILIFEDRLWITTNVGLLVSDSSSNIYTDSIISLQESIPGINFTHVPVPVTSLNRNSTSIIIGTDSKIFTGTDTEKVSVLYDDTSSTIPTIFVNYEMYDIGFTYYTVTNTVRFDHFIPHDSVVTVANQYQHYRARNKGWLDKRYDADLTVYRNGLLLANVSGDDAPAVASLLNVEFEDFTEIDSYVSGAEEQQEQFNTDVDNLVAAQEQGVTDLQPYISDAVDSYNKVYSNVHGRVRFVSVEEIDDESYVIFEYQKIPFDFYPQMLSDYETVPEIPDVLASDADGVVSCNVVSGVFSFLSSYNKYDFLTIDLRNTAFGEDLDNNHREIENGLQLINSGLSMSMGEVQESNLLKMGLFFERVWTGDQWEVDECFLPMLATYNLRYNLTTNNSWYDVLNSTVDYAVHVDYDDVGFDFDYPTAVYYESNIGKVLVGCRTGVITVDTTDYSLEVLDFNDSKQEFVREIKTYDNILYILTDDNLYRSSDHGINWSREELPNLSGKFLQFSKFRNFFIIATDNGVYYKSLVDDYWYRSLVNSEITKIHSGTYLVAIKDGDKVYYSSNAVDWVSGGTLLDNVRVNAIESYNGLLLLATDQGLRYDNSTFYSDAAATSLIDVAVDFDISVALEFNDVAVKSIDGDHVGGTSDGNYYVWNGSSYSRTVTDLESIHKIIYVNDEYWAFGYDSVWISSISHSIKITLGVPF